MLDLRKPLTVLAARATQHSEHIMEGVPFDVESLPCIVTCHARPYDIT